MEQTTIKGETRDLLALIPHQLGFQPRDSVVFVSLRGERGQVGVIARVDLSDLLGSAREDLLERLAYALQQDGASRVVLVVYTATDPRTAVERRNLAVIESRTAAHGMNLVDDTLVVTDTGYLALHCDDDFCCPPGGRPLSDLQSSEVAAEMTLKGNAPLPDRSGVGFIPLAPAGVRRRVADIRKRWEPTEYEARIAFRQLLDGKRTPRPLGRVEAALQVSPLRDEILADAIEAASGATFAPGKDRVDRVMQALFGEALRPDRDRLENVLSALGAVYAHGDKDHPEPASTLLAVLHWWTGDGATARAHAERALDADPSYRLASLIEQALDAAIPPAWVRREQDAFQR